MYLMTAAGADFCNFIQDVIVAGKGFMNKLLLSMKSGIVAEKVCINELLPSTKSRIVAGKVCINELLPSMKSRIVAGKKMSCNIPRKWSFGKKNMPLEKEKHGIRHIVCLGRGAEGRKICLIARKIAV